MTSSQVDSDPGPTSPNIRVNRYRARTTQFALALALAVFFAAIVPALFVPVLIVRVAFVALSVVLPALLMLKSMDPPSRLEADSTKLTVVRKRVRSERFEAYPWNQIRRVHITRGLGSHVHVSLELVSGGSA